MDLEARIDRLESIDEIKKLKHTYLTWCDLGYPPDKLGPLFTTDAVWTSPVMGRHSGRAAIEKLFVGVSTQIVFGAHLAMNSIIEVDGDHATGKWRILMPHTFMQDGHKVSRWMLGDYDDEYVRQDGKWLIRKIDYLANFNVPSLESWAGQEVVRS